MLTEWAYGRRYDSNSQRLAALPDWLSFYNHERPHTALLGQSPAESVNNVRGHHS